MFLFNDKILELVAHVPSRSVDFSLRKSTIQSISRNLSKMNCGET